MNANLMVYSVNSLSKIKDEACVISLDEYKSIGTHWIALFVNTDVGYFNSFGVEYIPNEIKKLIGNKNITKNIYTVQAYDSITCTHFCNGFIDFKFKDKSLLDYTYLFSRNEYEKNNKAILKHFQYLESINLITTQSKSKFFWI